MAKTTETNKVMKGSATALPDGSFVFRPYQTGREPVLASVVVTRHGGLYRSKQKIIVRLSFDERERAIRDRIISEAAEIVACSQW